MHGLCEGKPFGYKTALLRKAIEAMVDALEQQTDVKERAESGRRILGSEVCKPTSVSGTEEESQEY